jgi:hypothetical protein
MKEALAAGFQILIQALEVRGIDSHLGSRWHPFVRIPLGEDAQKLVSGRGVAVRPERQYETGSERGPLRVVPVASGAVQHQLLPSLVGCDLNGVAWPWVIGVVRDDGRRGGRRGAGGLRRASRDDPGTRPQGIEEHERGIPAASEQAGVAHSGPFSAAVNSSIVAKRSAAALAMARLMA